MAPHPQHPQNPCALPGHEQTPAKLWELLRRNDKFKQTVARLSELDRRAQSERARSQTWWTTHRMIQCLRGRHPFAAVALQWLVPEPSFHVTCFGPQEAADANGVVKLRSVIVAEGEGTTADLLDKANWRWRKRVEGTPDIAGHIFTRGPEIHWRTSEDPRYADKFDKANPIAEWRDYFSKRQFTFNTPWQDAPPGFQRTFLHLWCQLDSRGTNPITNTRSGAPERHEVSFFQDFSCYRMLTTITDRGHLSAEDFAHALRFAELSDHYRVFAFPASIRTRMEARDMADWLVEQLVQLPDGSQLPQREKEILGTPLEWEILLAYEDRRRQGDEHTPALQYTFDMLYAHQPAARRHAAKPAERTTDAALRHIVAKKLLIAAESARWYSWQDDFARIHSPLAGTGLIQRIFPRLASVLPPTPAPAAP